MFAAVVWLASRQVQAYRTRPRWKQQLHHQQSVFAFAPTADIAACVVLLCTPPAPQRCKQQLHNDGEAYVSTCLVLVAHSVTVLCRCCCLAALKKQLLEQGAASSADIMHISLPALVCFVLLLLRSEAAAAPLQRRMYVSASLCLVPHSVTVLCCCCCLAALKQQLLEQGAASSADIMHISLPALLCFVPLLLRSVEAAAARRQSSVCVHLYVSRHPFCDCVVMLLPCSAEAAAAGARCSQQCRRHAHIAACVALLCTPSAP
jgi:hypothetical protein